MKKAERIKSQPSARLFVQVGLSCGFSWRLRREKGRQGDSLWYRVFARMCVCVRSMVLMLSACICSCGPVCGDRLTSEKKPPEVVLNTSLSALSGFPVGENVDRMLTSLSFLRLAFLLTLQFILLLNFTFLTIFIQPTWCSVSYSSLSFPFYLFLLFAIQPEFSLGFVRHLTFR